MERISDPKYFYTLEHWVQRFLIPLSSLLTSKWRNITAMKGRVNLPPPESRSFQRWADLKLEEGCDSQQICHNHFLTPLVQRAPSQWPNLKKLMAHADTHFPQNSVSPIMLPISSWLLLPFNFQAKVLASLINRIGHLLAV